MRLLQILFASTIAILFFTQTSHAKPMPAVPLSRAYTYNATLLMDRYDLYWDIDETEGNLYLAMSCAAQGWVGLGFYTGTNVFPSMVNSDIILSYIDAENKVHVQDSFAPFYSQPIADENNADKPGGQQDLTIVGGGFDAASGRSVIEVRRKLVTNDPNDMQFTAAQLARETKIIFAYHTTAKPTSFANGAFVRHDVNLTGKMVFAPDAPLPAESSFIPDSSPTTSEEQRQESSEGNSSTLSILLFFAISCIALFQLI